MFHIDALVIAAQDAGLAEMLTAKSAPAISSGAHEKGMGMERAKLPLHRDTSTVALSPEAPHCGVIFVVIGHENVIVAINVTRLQQQYHTAQVTMGQILIGAYDVYDQEVLRVYWRNLLGYELDGDQQPIAHPDAAKTDPKLSKFWQCFQQDSRQQVFFKPTLRTLKESDRGGSAMFSLDPKELELEFLRDLLVGSLKDQHVLDGLNIFEEELPVCQMVSFEADKFPCAEVHCACVLDPPNPADLNDKAKQIDLADGVYKRVSLNLLDAPKINRGTRPVNVAVVYAMPIENSKSTCM